MTKLSKLRQRKIRLVKDRKRMKRKDDIACRLAIFPMQFFNHNNRIRLVWKMRIRMFFHDARRTLNRQAGNSSPGPICEEMFLAVGIGGR